MRGPVPKVWQASVMIARKHPLSQVALAVLIAARTSCAFARAAAPVPIWETVPSAGKANVTAGRLHDTPSLQPYLVPSERNTGVAVIICPGGSYAGLAEHEGAPVAEWLNTLGVSAFVLRYRLAPAWHHPAPLADALRAIRTVRTRAHAWKIRTDRIGILGFSAGGHLAASAAVYGDPGRVDATDPIERTSARPDWMILVYPLVTLGEATHLSSRSHLLGDNPAPNLINDLSLERHVDSRTPPAFIVHGTDDKDVSAANALLLANALRKVRVPFELHLLAHGEHGFGLGTGNPYLSRWTEWCAAWMRMRNIIP